MLSIVSVSRGVPMVDLADGVNARAKQKTCGGFCPLGIVSVARGVPMVALAGQRAARGRRARGVVAPRVGHLVASV